VAVVTGEEMAAVKAAEMVVAMVEEVMVVEKAVVVKAEAIMQLAQNIPFTS
jgi:hypothetical protein